MLSFHRIEFYFASLFENKKITDGLDFRSIRSIDIFSHFSVLISLLRTNRAIDPRISRHFSFEILIDRIKFCSRRYNRQSYLDDRSGSGNNAIISVTRIRTNEETYPGEERSVVNKSGSDLKRKLSPSSIYIFHKYSLWRKKGRGKKNRVANWRMMRASAREKEREGNRK